MRPEKEAGQVLCVRSGRFVSPAGEWPASWPALPVNAPIPGTSHSEAILSPSQPIAVAQVQSDAGWRCATPALREAPADGS